MSRCSGRFSIAYREIIAFDNVVVVFMGRLAMSDIYDEKFRWN